MQEIIKELEISMLTKINALCNFTTDSFMKIDRGGQRSTCYQEIIKTHNA